LRFRSQQFPELEIVAIEIAMAPNLKRKGDVCPLSPDTKRARKKIVNKMAEQVYEMQLDGPKYGSKYGSVSKMVSNARKVYPWVDDVKIYNSLKHIKIRKAKEKEKLGRNAQVLQERERNKKAVGRPKGQTNTVINTLKDKKKSAISEVASRYSDEKKLNGGRVSNGSFEKIRDEVLYEFDIPEQDIKVRKATILSRITRNSLIVDA
jgi:hypothetical protein